MVGFMKGGFSDFIYTIFVHCFAVEGELGRGGFARHAVFA